MKKISPQQQVWEHLRTDEQRTILAQNLRHLKHRTQEDICYGILAFIRWGIERHFEDPCLENYNNDILLFLKIERMLGRI